LRLGLQCSGEADDATVCQGFASVAPTVLGKPTATPTLDASAGVGEVDTFFS
jgi:hypothetical protein